MTWKPGDVAIGQISRWVGRVMWEGDCWVDEDGDSHDVEKVTNVRPLVVIDPENREQVRSLLETYGRQFTDWTPELDSNVTRLQEALREFAAPKPSEPQGLGAVVRDANDGIWIRVEPYHPGSASFVHAWRFRAALAEAIQAPWAKVNAVQVLSEGWAE